MIGPIARSFANQGGPTSRATLVLSCHLDVPGKV